jgi:hypothetical protein
LKPIKSFRWKDVDIESIDVNDVYDQVKTDFTIYPGLQIATSKVGAFEKAVATTRTILTPEETEAAKSTGVRPNWSIRRRRSFSNNCRRVEWRTLAVGAFSEAGCKSFPKTEIRVIPLPISELSPAAGGFGDGRMARLRLSRVVATTLDASLRWVRFFIFLSRNALKSPISAKGMQGNASDFTWIYLDLFARGSRLSCILASIVPDWSH